MVCRGGARMAASPQHQAEPGDGLNIQGPFAQQWSFAAQLRNTLNTIPAYTWYSVPSGTLTFVNERYADYLGLPKDHPLRFGVETGVPWDTHLQLLHLDNHEETRRVGATILRTGSAAQATFRIRNAQGGYRWFLSRVEPFRASDGTLLCFIGINLDIEERMAAEEKIREKEMELRQMLDLAPQLVGVLGPQRERIYANKVALAYYGVSLDEWRQRNNVPEVHPDDFDRVKAYIDRSLISGAANEVECACAAATEPIAGSWFVPTLFETTRDKSCGGTSRVPI